MELRWIYEKWDYGLFRLQYRKTKKSPWQHIPHEGPLPPKNESPREVRTPKCECGHRQKWHQDKKSCIAPLPENRVCDCKGFKLKAGSKSPKKQTQKK